MERSDKVFVLGISCFYHDAAAALLKDGRLIAAAEEERFSRQKHDSAFPLGAVNFVLKKAGIAEEELSYVVFYEKPFLKMERILMTTFQFVPKSRDFFKEAMISWLLDKLWIKNIIKDKVKVKEDKIFFVEHHLSHAASAYLCSPFEESAIITADALGEWVTTTLGEGKGGKISLFKEIRFPHSLGLLYSTFTSFLGFEVNEGEYKVMGMAPYGRPKYIDKIYKLVNILDDGSFYLNQDYFCYPYSLKKMFNLKFEELFGKPRAQKEGGILNQYYADLAASIQFVTEEVLLKMANFAYRETGLKRLCIAGGVGLNSVANSRILKEAPFDEIYIQPAAGDAGGAVGAALYFYNCVLGKRRVFVMEHPFWGEEYSHEQIKNFLDKMSVKYFYVDNEERLFDLIVESLSEEKVVGWFQGRFEWGPRALGNRSILADPRNKDMKDIVNRKVKFREPFRPFAPSVLAERSEEFFELDNPEKHYPARFMLYVLPVKDDKKSIIPAVTHVDGTARAQIVRREDNPCYYRLIEKFGEANGVPVLLNTSFNLKGEPIVRTPEDAFNTFKKSGMDVLVLGRFVIKKNP